MIARPQISGYTPRMSDDPIEDLALGAFRLVKERLGFDLDFTPETLPVVDHYLLELRDEDGGRPDEKVVSVVGPCVGAYFGEVVRRSLPGLRWYRPEDAYRRWRLEGMSFFLAFNPVGAALEAIYGETAAGWGAHLALLPEQRELIERSLEATGGVREEDFHRLAIRHEALEQTVVLLEELERAGEGRSFGPEAYRSLADG